MIVVCIGDTTMDSSVRFLEGKWPLIMDTAVVNCVDGWWMVSVLDEGGGGDDDRRIIIVSIGWTRIAFSG